MSTTYILQRILLKGYLSDGAGTLLQESRSYLFLSVAADLSGFVVCLMNLKHQSNLEK